mgnify:CR=1 FL=1
MRLYGKMNDDVKNGEKSMKKVTCVVISVLMLMVAILSMASAEVTALPVTPVVGIAWRADTDSEFFTNICRAVEEAGGTWVMLDQVCSADLSYDGGGKLAGGVTALGALDEASAKYVRCNTWHGSNAEEAVGAVQQRLRA